MNKSNDTPQDDLLVYQTRRLQELMQETVQCCEMRTDHLSRKFCVPKAELRCMLLFQGERYLTVKGIAQKLEVTKSRVTKILEGLLRKNLVAVIDDPKDARVKLVSLTPQGQKRSDEIAAFTWELHRKLLLELGVVERKNVLSSLELLRASMEALKKELV